ncbi:MAG: sulfite exporter TauE/SafE family protein [Nocardioides sp.]
MPDLSTVLLLGMAAMAAGFVDAVVGGGGLIQLPALLLGLPGYAPVHVLATNKMASICGTTTSAVTYFRRVGPDPRTFVPLMALAFLGSAGGAEVATHLSAGAFKPIVLAALVVIGAWVWFRPTLGGETLLRHGPRRHLVTAMVIGAAIGFYDGALGPGTGSFFVISLVGLLGYSFLESSAKSKMANVATNLAALVVFIPQGAVLWRLALVMGACNVVGGYLGARLAVARGAAFVRVFFLLVVGGFIVRIGGEVLGLW